jgi:hypothetical protein
VHASSLGLLPVARRLPRSDTYRTTLGVVIDGWLPAWPYDTRISPVARGDSPDPSTPQWYARGRRPSDDSTRVIEDRHPRRHSPGREEQAMSYRYLAALMAVVSALTGLSIAIAAEAQDTSTVVRTASGTVRGGSRFRAAVSRHALRGASGRRTMVALPAATPTLGGVDPRRRIRVQRRQPIRSRTAGRPRPDRRGDGQLPTGRASHSSLFQYPDGYAADVNTFLSK